jgi:predicted protein tyrosine phosphatase
MQARFILAGIGLSIMVGPAPAQDAGQAGGDRPEAERQRERPGGGRGDGRGFDRGDFGGRGFGGGRFGEGGFGGGGGFGGRGGPGARGALGQLLQPEYLRRDLPVISEALELDREQRSLTETLLLDYEAAFNEAAAGIRARLEEIAPRPEVSEADRQARQAGMEAMRSLWQEMRALREASPEGEPDAQRMEEIRARMEPLREQLEAMGPRMPEGAELQAINDAITALAKAWRADRSRLGAEFLNNVQAILNDRQIEAWPELEQTLRRMKSLPRGRLSGEDVDLIAIVNRLGLSVEQGAAMAEVLSSYSASLDRALRQREAYFEVGRDGFLSVLATGDANRAAAMMREETSLRVAVRDVNASYAGSIAAGLAEHASPQAAAAFDGEWLQSAYPRIHRQGSMARTFEAALGLEGIDEETAAAIVELQAAHRSETEAANRRLVALTRTHEPERAVDRVAQRVARGAGAERGRRGERQGENDPLSQAFQARGDMDQGYRERLEAMLTPEQAAQLPPPQPQGNRRQRRGG